MRFLRLGRGFSQSVLVLGGIGVIVVACGDHEGRLIVPTDGGSPSYGGQTDQLPNDSGAGGGADVSPGEGGMAPSAGVSERGGASGGLAAGAPEGGSPIGGSPTSSGGTTSVAGSVGDGGVPAMPSGGTAPHPASCVYSTEGTEPSEDEQASGGAGGGGPEYTITVSKNAFVGSYLTDANGKALYVYARDFAGDCEYPPITNCFDDCAVSWPIFDAAPRVVAPELDDGLFGRIERMDKQSDGSFKLTYQTTYRGWPLYYYKTDALPGDVKGQGKGSVWHLAEVVLPNLVIIRSGSGETDKKTLADEFGHTLYVYAEDMVGTDTTAPVSACTGSCLDEFHPFMLPYVSPVSYIEPSTVTVFVRDDGRPQLAYKGAPLYSSQRDLRSGDMKGLEVEGFTWAAP